MKITVLLYQITFIIWNITIISSKIPNDLISKNPLSLSMARKQNWPSLGISYFSVPKLPRPLSERNSTTQVNFVNQKSFGQAMHNNLPIVWPAISATQQPLPLVNWSRRRLTWLDWGGPLSLQHFNTFRSCNACDSPHLNLCFGNS